MLPRAEVIEAVEKLNYRVTVGDVAAQSGLNLAIAANEVMNLATLTGGNMQVSETGEIAYVFTPNLKNILLARSLRLRLQQTWALIWKWLFWLIRISFGILLVVSIVIVVVGIVLAFLAIQASQSGRDDDRSDRPSSSSGDRGGYGMGGWFSPGGWIYWGNPFSVFSPSYYDAGDNRPVNSNQDSEMGFLEGVFSFLFGDGNPNPKIEEQRFQAIATVIRQNQGTVIAEQISPYVDDLGKSFQAEREDYMLPIMVRFNGYPKVSEQGTLAYSFPDLQKVASTRQNQAIAPHFSEQPWQFSKAGAGKITLSVGLGIFYVAGAFLLGSLLQDPRVVAAVAVPGALSFIAGIFGFLLGYAILFLTIPLVRFLIWQWLSGKVNLRNQQRQNRAEKILNPAPELKQKLAFAKQMAIAQEVIDAKNLAYTTETDYADQEFAKMQQEINDSLLGS